MKDIRALLGKQRLFADGGTGTLLQAQGLKGGELSDSWNLAHPERIVALHRAYIDAGANLITTNTFSANRLRIGDALEETVRAGVACAQEARGERTDVFIGLDVGPSGHLLKPMGDLAFEDAVESFAEVVRAGAQAGADYIMIETMSDALEAKAAVLAAKENCDLPVFVTLIFDESGKLLTGGTPASTTAMLEGLRVDAIGVNCGLGPVQLLPVVRDLCEATSLPVIVNPNAGLPHFENGQTIYQMKPDEFARAMKEIAALPVQILGGCCGTTPDYIRTMIEACADLPLTCPQTKSKTVIASFSGACEIGKKPLLIGERINPTGKKRLQEALRNTDMEYVLKEAIDQEEAGAHILDVNVGLPDLDEPSVMRETVTALQSVTALPLQIDSSDAAALEAGLRVYNGKALINSVNGKKEVMDAVFPLVQKYGGVLIALPLDEDGIPETVNGRIRIAKKILEEASRYGISSKDIVLDGLAMTISAAQEMAEVAIGVIRRAKEELGLHTVLGVSNISFGLPQRSIINAHFFTSALTAGLSLGIINPLSAPMMQAYKAHLALAGYDRDCADFIASYGDVPESGSTSGTAGKGASTEALRECVLRGLAGEAGTAAAEELAQGKEALDVIDTILIPALDDVGKRFEKGILYLPQLLKSAEAAKAAFAVLREKMRTDSAATKGEIILATVKGDIHDIGKNIVKVLLENYGYAIIDMGKDVPPEEIVEETKKRQIRLVGLSALMTTTVTGMEETIRQLREECPWTKVVVGGAVLTEEVAASIGADGYAKDGMEAVRFADTVFGG